MAAQVKTRKHHLFPARLDGEPGTGRPRTNTESQIMFTSVPNSMGCPKQDRPLAQIPLGRNSGHYCCFSPQRGGEARKGKGINTGFPTAHEQNTKSFRDCLAPAPLTYKLQLNNPIGGCTSLSGDLSITALQEAGPSHIWGPRSR